ncbi:MAG TPA: 50S ribosomal protein L15 [bacterium]|mgnify:CR=1 FL=1|nr:50S ribosomal protein L15 [bacterium]
MNLKNNMELFNIKKLNNDRKSKRVGRGRGSGKGGHTVGRGQKGQKARKGAKPNLGFEGGQSPLYKKLPRIGGFKRPYITKSKALGVSLDIFNKFKDGEEITPISLVEKKVLKDIPSGGVKILSKGELKKKVVFKDFTYSEKAKEKIESFGATINA